MTASDLRHLSTTQKLDLLRQQINAAASLLQADEFAWVDYTEDWMPGNALMAIGDFLVYPRFHDNSSRPPANPEDCQHQCQCDRPPFYTKCPPGKGIDPQKSEDSLRIVETAPLPVSSPAADKLEPWPWKQTIVRRSP